MPRFFDKLALVRGCAGTNYPFFTLKEWNGYSVCAKQSCSSDSPTGYQAQDDTHPDQGQGKQPPQRPTSLPKSLDLRQDPLIVSAVEEIKQNAAPLRPGERPTLTGVVIVPGQISNVDDTKLIDASGAVSPAFTGTVQPIAYIPLDQGCNIIPAGNGVVLAEQGVTERGPESTTSGRVMPPENGVFIDIQAIVKGTPTTEIKQGVRVQQGRIQIDTGPNRITRCGSRYYQFYRRSTKNEVLP